MSSSLQPTSYKLQAKKTRGFVMLIPLILLVAVFGFLFVVVYMITSQILQGGKSGGLSLTGGNFACFASSKETSYKTPATSDPAAPTDAFSQGARQYAVNTLKIDQASIKEYAKSEIENLIRAEIACQWPQVPNKYNATQVDAQQAILAYAYHEDAALRMFVKKGDGLEPQHDATTVQLLSITRDKWGCPQNCNKRQEIALNWDVKYTIFMGVRENMDAFKNASGQGKARWRAAVQHVAAGGWTPARFEEGLKKYANETEFNPALAAGGTATSSSGSCDATQSISGIDVPEGGKGKIVREQHLVTEADEFGANEWPKSQNDKIDTHYRITGYNQNPKEGWTPSEGGQIGQGSGGKVPLAAEPWVMNMRVKKGDQKVNFPRGTKIIITAQSTGKSVVAAGGYEWGPGGTNYIAGAQSEVLNALGVETGGEVSIGIAQNQSLPFGLINCTSK